MRKISVKSVTEYLTKIKKYKLSDCIIRGECAKFDCIQSGMFREKFPKKNAWVIQQYYNLVGNSLSEMQRKHFTAFSQHYGIPTNLIDFTTSPLVALFFACQNKEFSETGYVHFIECNKLIDIGDNVDYINQLNFLKQILSFSDENFENTVEFVQKICDMFLIYQDENIEPLLFAIDYYIKFATNNTGYRNCGIRVPDFNKIRFDVTYEDLSRQLKNQSTDILNEQQCDLLNRVYARFEIDTMVIDYILYFLIILKVVHEFFEPTWKWGIDTLNLPFYIVYRPPLIVPRIENQSSIFIQQQYLAFDVLPNEYVFDPVVQKIKPDRTIEVTNKQEILSELDALGINEKFIFNDYDHIAHYLKQKIYK